MYIDRNTAAIRERTYERPDPVSLTEQAGYIPPQEQIESMILAGQRLNEARASQYDFASEDDIDEDASDPTRRGNFDLADASQMAMETEMSLRDQALEANKSRKALQIAQDASGGAKKGSEVPDVPPPEKGA